MSSTLRLIFLFFSLLLLQVFVLNNVLFLGYVNPYLYVAFVFLFPLKQERYLFLILSFLLGISIDFFSNSGGIHAFSLVLIAYTRLFFIRVIFKKTVSDFQFFELFQEPFSKIFNYVVILTVIHHFSLFLLANFSAQNFGRIILNTLYSSIFTIVLFFLAAYILRKRK
ncbi:MAG: rod shape-determining protein MreD [Flavobacteriaceae bacterium]|nr:rod shape-determining protein MreD [Flavobacteriaceae bacterium]